MARQTQARGDSRKPQDTSTLLWLGGGALGVAAIIMGMSALTESTTDQPTKKPITPIVRTTALANTTSDIAPVSQNPNRSQAVGQRPAVAQPPTPAQPVPRAESVWDSPMPAERPQSALGAYFYDLQVHRTDRSDYIQGIMDSEVTWIGYIREVNSRQDGPTLLLTASPSKTTFDIAYIDFPAGFNEKLSDLATMDKVRIKGFYRGGGPMPHVDGRSVELVEE